MASPRRRRSFPPCFFLMICLMPHLGACNVVLMANNATLSFDDVEAIFTPEVKGSGVKGVLYAVEPLDACSPLRTNAVEDPVSPFALVIRGGCQFDVKVRNAQNAGFKAAIVYDDEDRDVLVSMAGSLSGVHIYAVFVSKASGEVLKKYSGQTETELWIIPTYENSAWSIMAISFISLLAMSAVLATCFFVRRHQIRQDRAQLPQARESHGMSSQLVKAMPSLIFTKVQEDNCTSATCAICLEDYSVGEKLRVLPCRHKFHAACVDLWLTSWRTFCPVCKRDANAGTSNPPVSESTPLLSSAIRLPADSTALASFRSTVAASPPRPIIRHPSSQSISRNYSISGHGFPSTPNPTYANSSPICTSGSSMDLANMSSPWSRTSHFAPRIRTFFVRWPLVPTDQHQIYLSTCLPFWLWISQLIHRLITHVPWIAKLLPWIFRATSLPEALHIVRPEPVHHGAPVTATEPAAAWWGLRNKPISCRINSLVPSALPAALS